jgi:fatty acid desaturase
MKQLSILTDPVYVPKEKYTAYDLFWLRFINDKRDLPFINLLTAIHLTVVPVAIILFTPLLTGLLWWALALPYFYVAQFYYKGRFGLMFHCICHRKLFKKRYQWLHTYITWLICPLFGHAPEGYHSHHLGMHHIENNLPDDTSSTMGYQRDSLRNFLAYFFNFLFLGVKDTILYLYYHKRRKMYLRFTAGEFAFYIFCIVLGFVNLKAALVVFIIPVLFARLVMMLGNWTQHAFIDSSEPDNLFTSSINCINTPYNNVCWNDGYHIIHHLRPGMHYTDMPNEFLKQAPLFAANKALVFDGLHYLHIFTYLLTRRYDKLADNLVNINDMFTSSDEAIQLMRDRTRKITVT